MTTSTLERTDTGEDAYEAIRYVMANCRGGDGDCRGCPINVEGNSRECAYYLIGLVRKSDWSGWTDTSDGTVPNEYLTEEGTDGAHSAVRHLDR